MVPSFASAQNENCTATTMAEFFECYGSAASFGTHSVAAMTTFIEAEDAIVAGDYAGAKTMIDAIFSDYPVGSRSWGDLFDARNGSNTGTPHAYYGLRMMQDIVDYNLNPNEAVEAKTVKMTVVLVGCSQGIQPTTEAELESGTGPFVTNTIAPELLADDYRIIRQSQDLFSRYITAITGGELVVELEVVELSDLCMDVSVSSSAPFLASGPVSQAWDVMDEAVLDGTDWWWMMYPSNVPEGPDFDDKAFITGGMGVDGKGGPAFIADDKFMVRKPAHLGVGIYSDIERRIYLPQWMQHEFFHHLYRIYPEYNFEVSGHDWFNRNFWPDDFVGQYEADFYAETLHKRLQNDCVPLSVKLITRIDEEVREEFTKLGVDELLGTYSLDVATNGFHTADIIREGDRYFWRNESGVQWEVMPRLTDGRLETGDDSPYPGEDFFIQLYRTLEGELTPGIVALKFQGELYVKRFGLLRESVPIEIATGNYTRSPEESTLHTGNLIKEGGLFFWENEAGDRWSLTPNAETEVFVLGADSPSPDVPFELILIEDECELRVLGFRYLDDYFWRDKVDPQNESPIMLNPLPDLELAENFGTHTIDIADVFLDPEGDDISLFAASSESGLVSASVDGQELVLSGADQALVTIRVMGLDANGGLILDEFDVQVGFPVSSNDPTELTGITVFPNPTRGIIKVQGDLMNADISILSADNSLLLNITAVLAEEGINIDLSTSPNGVYLIKVTDQNSGRSTLKKVVKQ